MRWPVSGGYVMIFPAALQVLEEFGGLSISWRHPWWHHAPLHLDPLLAFVQEDVESWVYYEWQLDDRLFPLGVLGLEQDTVFIGQRGRIFTRSSISGEFFLLGDSFGQALEGLILARPPLRLQGGDVPRADEVAQALRELPRSAAS